MPLLVGVEGRSPLRPDLIGRRPGENRDNGFIVGAILRVLSSRVLNPALRCCGLSPNLSFHNTAGGCGGGAGGREKAGGRPPRRRRDLRGLLRQLLEDCLPHQPQCFLAPAVHVSTMTMINNTTMHSSTAAISSSSSTNFITTFLPQFLEGGEAGVEERAGGPPPPRRPRETRTEFIHSQSIHLMM